MRMRCASGSDRYASYDEPLISTLPKRNDLLRHWT